MEVKERPLVTFFVCAYQQERFIREAVEGAFAQTYSPLEIILSDDCSSDRTFAIMQEMAAAYRGPHQIILNRNEKNLGIGGHINRIFELSHGELLVASAGDDVSLPERTEILVGSWIQGGRPLASVFSNAIEIDEFGLARRDRVFRKSQDVGMAMVSLVTNTGDWRLEVLPLTSGSMFLNNWVLGATQMFHRAAFVVFGGLGEGVIQEDRVIPFRLMLMGGTVVYVDQPLVKYRRHLGNAYPDNPPEKLRQDFHLRRLKQEIALEKSRISDLQVARQRQMISDALQLTLSAELRERTDRATCRLMHQEGKPLAALAHGLKSLARSPSPFRLAGWLAARLVPMILSRYLGWKSFRS